MADIILFNYEDIIQKLKEVGIPITWRKLNFYKSLGLLPKPQRMPKDKRGYYPQEILEDLTVYHFLQNHIGYTLTEIKDLIGVFKLPYYVGYTLGEVKDLVDAFRLPSFMNYAAGQNTRSPFTMWIVLSYTAYLKRMLAIRQKRGTQDAVKDMLLINEGYKKAMKEKGPASAKKSFTKLKISPNNHEETLRSFAEAWVDEVIVDGE